MQIIVEKDFMISHNESVLYWPRIKPGSPHSLSKALHNELFVWYNFSIQYWNAKHLYGNGDILDNVSASKTQEPGVQTCLWPQPCFLYDTEILVCPSRLKRFREVQKVCNNQKNITNLQNRREVRVYDKL